MKVYLKTKVVEFNDNSYPIKVDLNECSITELKDFENVLESLYFLKNHKNSFIADEPVENFHLFCGVCSNVRLRLINQHIVEELNASFNSLDLKNLNNREKLENISYPVGGSIEYNTEKFSKVSLWQNPRRWEYVDFLINSLEKLACQLR